MVLFWLKNLDDKRDRLSFENVLNEFIFSNPKVVRYHIGQTAATSRTVIYFPIPVAWWLALPI